MPIRYKQTIERLLQDRDIQVQLYAAETLWPYDNRQAEDLFVSSFTHQDPRVQFFAHAIFWDFNIHIEKLYLPIDQVEKQITRCINKYYPLLIKATHSNISQVRHIAAKRLRKLEEVAFFIPSLQKHLKSDISAKALHRLTRDGEKTIIRMEAMAGLALMGRIDLIIDEIILNPKKDVFIRVAGFLATLGVKPSPNLLTMISGFVKDKDPRVRMLALRFAAELKKSLPRGNFLHTMVERTITDALKDKNPNTKMAGLMGLLGSKNRPEIISNVKVTDEQYQAIEGEKIYIANSRQQFRRCWSAAMAHALSYYKTDSSHTQFPDPKGAAIGYTWRLRSSLAARYFPVPQISQIGETVYHTYIVTLWNLHQKINSHIYWQRHLGNIKRAILLNPQNSHYLFERGMLLFFVDRRNEAIETILKVVTNSPQFPIYRYWLAHVYYENGSYAKAYHHINLFLQNRPKNTYGWRLKMNIETKDRSRYQNAQEHLKLLNPIEYHFSRGQALFKKGYYEPALQEFSMSVPLKNRYAKRFALWKAYCLFKLNKPKEGIRYLQNYPLYFSYDEIKRYSLPPEFVQYPWIRKLPKLNKRGR